MRHWLHRFWLWLRVIRTGKMKLSEIATDIKDTVKSAVGKPKPYNPRTGRVIWDARLGTFRRRFPKIGRNAPCPCGSMRTAPQDIEKINKYKWCCRRA